MDQQKIQLIFEAINKAQGAFTELKNGLKDLDEGHKRVGQTDLFKKLKENWVAISVAVYAVAKAVREAWEYMEKGAKAEQSESAFRSVAAAAGESADKILEEMKRASDGMVDDSDIMQKAVKGMIQGLSGDQIVNIMKASRTAAVVAGQDVSQAYETITDAIANKMPRSLLQYGLVTKEQMRLLNEAMAMGVTEVDLYAVVMENAAKQQSMLTDAQKKHMETMQRWKAMFNEIKEGIGKALFWLMDNVVAPAIESVQRFAVKLIDLFMRLAAGWSWVISGFKGGVGALKQELLNLDRAYVESMAEIDKKHGKGATGSPPGGKGTTSSAADTATSRLKHLVEDLPHEIQVLNDKLTNLDIAEKERSISHLDAAQKRLQIEQQILNKLQEQYNAKTWDAKKGEWANTISDPKARETLLKQIDDAKKKLLEFRLTVRELNDDFQGGVKEGFSQYLSQAKSAFQQGVYLAQEAAKAMESAFSDLFFDLMTGKAKSWADYMRGLLHSIARAVANVLAQQMAYGLIGTFASPVAPVPVSPYGPAPQLHKGGYIPRFHVGGLNSDERAAILQTGEYVMSRRGVAALDQINKGNVGGGGVNIAVNVDNKSGALVDVQPGGAQWDGEKYVVGLIVKNYEQGGALRKLMTQK